LIKVVWTIINSFCHGTGKKFHIRQKTFCDDTKRSARNTTVLCHTVSTVCKTYSHSTTVQWS
jgi:hypothetical protein